jgi:opine dehydrogenase
LAEAGWGDERPIILNPGHTGGIFEFSKAYSGVGASVPPLAEFSTLAYVARKPEPAIVNITGRAAKLRVASLPGDAVALDLARRLFPGAYDTGDVLASALCNVNMVIHTPCAILAAAWVEATQGDFRFYVEGMTPGVVNVMRELDRERMQVGAALGHRLPTIIAEMKAIGTVPTSAGDEDYDAIARGEANAAIRAPDGLSHRYYVEDFGHGLVPFVALASIAGVETPVAKSLIALCRAAIGSNWDKLDLRDAEAMGIAGMTRQDLKEHVTARKMDIGA